MVACLRVVHGRAALIRRQEGFLVPRNHEYRFPPLNQKSIPLISGELRESQALRVMTNHAD